MKSQLTKAILPRPLPLRTVPQITESTLNRYAIRADTFRVITSATFLAPWAMLWVVLIRGLLVRAQILPRTCSRCGQPLERARLGESICRCH
jgi:hypothetical protein